MKALITGITGQDGSYLAELLLAKGYEVVGVYRRSSVPTLGRVEQIQDSRFRVVCGDVTDYSSINTIITKERPDEVYNLAAQSHVGVSFSQPLLTWDCTAVGCVNILESLRHLYSDSYKPKFYQASSSEMFGDKYDCEYDERNGAYEWDFYQNEGTEMNPQSPYAVAKLAAHKMSQLYRKYGMYTANGILFNHESPRRGEHFVTRKITKYVAMVYKDGLTFGGLLRACDKFVHFGDHNLNSEKLAIPKLRLGNLDASRDWGFAGDYVEAMWLMLQQDKGDDFVIATGKTHTIRDFCEYSFGVVGLNWQDFVVTDAEFVRPAEVPFLKGDASKANKVLGWKPKVSCQELAKMMVESDIRG